MRSRIEQDGSISIYYGDRRLLWGIYPGIDGHPVRVQALEYTENEMIWKTVQGEIHCRIVPEQGNGLELNFSLCGWQERIHTFFLLYEAETTAEGFYQAAEGMGHETGYYTEEELAARRNTASYGLCALRCRDCAVTLYAKPSSPEEFWYETVFELDVREREKYTNGWSKAEKAAELRLSCGARLEQAHGSEVKFAPLRVLATDTIEEGLERAAQDIGDGLKARRKMPPAYHWCSWYYCYQNFDRDQLREYLSGLKTLKREVPIRYVQIDAGYFPAVGDWLMTNERFPDGLAEAFAEIVEAGYQPGIWIGPFMVGNRSQLYREHPDWVLHDLDEKPVQAWIMDNEPKVWGYQDEVYYILDTSHPEAMAYMRRVFRTLRSMGAVMFKTDFMLWGLQDSTRVKRYTPGKTSVEYFRDFLKMIREEIGEESYWLGCIAPFLPFVGYADGMRIGGDVGSSWDGTFGPQNMMRCLVGNNYINHHYFQTDADAVMLRDFHIRLSEREIYSLALLAAMAGSCIYTSDPLHLLSEERLALFEFVRPDERRRKPRLPFLEEKRTEIVMVQQEENRALLYVLNPSQEQGVYTYNLNALGFDRDWKAYHISTGEQEELWHGNLVLSIPPHGCALLLLSKEQEVQVKRGNLWENLE